MADESLFWADQIAREVKERVANDKTLQKVVKEKGYICYDEKTPSGRIHIGSGRGWVIHDTVAKAMREIGLNAKFILSADDMDPLDAIPAGLDAEKYKPLMGVPMKNVPSPEAGYDSFADYYFKDSTDKFPEFGIEAKLERTSQHYENGDFNPYIKLALDNFDKIQKIYADLYGANNKASEKLPFNPICEKCGKIGTTVAYAWDSERQVLKYRCSKNLVEWASGCEYEGEISPYNGNGKFPWKIEWAAKWPTVGVLFETAGKDHFTKGGSRDVAVRVCTQVFHYPPPYPSSPNDFGKGYEFFTVGGRKMSTSKGVGASFREISEKLSPHLLRYLLVRTRPHAVIDFDPFGTNKLLLLYDNFDRCERIYFNAEVSENEKEIAQEKRIYTLSTVGKLPEKLPVQIPLSLASLVVQSVNLNIEKSLEILQRMGKITTTISMPDKKYVIARLKDAISFVKEFAPEEYKFTVLENSDKQAISQLNEIQKAALKKLAAILKQDLSVEELEQQLYELARESKLESKDFFKAAYLALIGKERGPRLAQFLSSLDKKFVIERFNSL